MKDNHPPVGPAVVNRRFEVSERAFKIISFWTTLLGLVIMAAGLQALVFQGAFVRFVLLFLFGGLVASTSVVLTPRPEPGFAVELVTRQGCSLCEEAEAWLAAKADEYDYTLWLTDVDEDPALAEQYGDHVPVAFVTTGTERGARARGTELFRLKADYPVVERTFKRLADARIRGNVRPPEGRARR